MSRPDMSGLEFEVHQDHEWLEQAAAGVVMFEELDRVLGEKGYRYRDL